MNKLVRAVVKNLKGVDYIEIVFGDVTDIAGDEGAGKSSFVDAVMWAFEGTRPIQDMPIRDGEIAAYTLLETENVIITREYTKDETKPNGYRTTLKIKGRAGGTFSQTDLTKMFPNLIDPSKFFDMDAKDVIKTLLGFLSKEEQNKLALINEQLGDREEERLFCSRNLKKTGVPEKVEEVEAVSASDLIAQKEEIVAFNREQDEQREKIETQCEDISSQVETINDLKRQIKVLQVSLKTSKDVLAKMKNISYLEPQDRKSTNTIDEQIDQVDANNTKAVAYQNYLRRLNERKDIERDHEIAEERIKKLRGQKKDIMANAKLPGDDLVEIADNRVFVRSRPIEQLSTSEKILFGAEMAMAANSSPDDNRIRTIIIRRGESLGKKTFKKLCELREKYNYQLLIESVGEGHSPDAIILEEGKIKEKSDD